MPIIVLLFSGKRKSGKDTVTDILFERVRDVAVNIKISAPIKSHFAQSKGLDYDQLMGTGSYKEQFRQHMVEWSEGVRRSDHGYFCRAALTMTNAAEKSVWIVSDVRRQTDLQWFRQNYDNIVTVRVQASPSHREKRGWLFTPGIDDQETECDLDSVDDWDLVIDNNGTLLDLEPCIDHLVKTIRAALKPVHGTTLTTLTLEKRA